MPEITHFEIIGMFGNKAVSLDISDNAVVLVGPNGIGKSTVANIFYFFISRQWARLLDYSFTEIGININKQQLSFKREDISGLSALANLPKSYPEYSRFPQYWDRLLLDSNSFQLFLASDRLNLKDRERYARLLSIPVNDVNIFHRQLLRRLTDSGGDLFGVPRIELEKQLASLIDTRILYLPTYRRIEKELKEIFPDFEERYRAHTGAGDTFRSGRYATHFVELVSFGMEDVKKRLATRTRELREYSLAQHNELSALYLRDVIHGKADKYTANRINTLTEKGVNEILDRVSESALSKEDKTLLRKKISAIQGRPKIHVSANDRYLAHYFSRLVAVNEDIKLREREITSFVDVCNEYLAPSKRMAYDEINFEVTIYDDSGRPIDPGVLSSGEKQVIAIFSHLYLDNAKNQIVVIDEPELSLSVPWQKRFLSDIERSDGCGFVMAVTHSPFIYDQNLRTSAIDLRRVTKTIPN